MVTVEIRSPKGVGVYDLTPEQYWGMLIMALILLGPEGQEIQFTELRNGNPRRMRLAYLLHGLGHHLLAYDSVYRPERPRDSWDGYYQSFPRRAEYEVQPSDYTAHIIGRGEGLVKFQSAEFLQGLLTVLKWFDLNPADYIFELGRAGEEVEYE